MLLDDILQEDKNVLIITYQKLNGIIYKFWVNYVLLENDYLFI